MPCEEVKSAKYQTRKSPPYHAGECRGEIMAGKDGKYISKADTRGVFKWIKVANKTRKAAKGSKTYDIHDNGGRPFRVEIAGKNVKIFMNVSENDNNNFSKLVKDINVKEVFIGKDPEFPGNSILLHISGNTYMCVGRNIYQFNMEKGDSPDKYFSLVGNSDVPYPVLLGKTHVYFMLDYTVVPRDQFGTGLTDEKWEDAYAIYFGYSDAQTGEGIHFKNSKYGKAPFKKVEHKMKGFKIVQDPVY